VIQDFVVEIFVPVRGAAGKKGKIATGYPVTGEHILTARHPLFPERPARDKGRPIEVRWRCDGVGRDWRRIDGIVWEDAGWDLALLAYRPPEGVDPWAGCLSEERPTPDAKWYSVGFPRVGGKRDNERVPFPMSGKLKPTIAGEPRFHIEEASGPDDPADWKGASGSPVFLGRYDTRIVGVIVSVPEKLGARRLSAVPMWRVLREDPTFCEKIGYHQRKERFEGFKDALKAVLARDAGAVDALAGAVRGLEQEIDGQTSGKRAEKLAERLLQFEVEPFLRIIDTAYRRVTKGHPQSAEAISEVARLLLPALYDHGVVENVRSACGDVEVALLSVPAHLETIAEIVMAGADRRAAEFCVRRPERSYPKGVLCLPEPPEGGFDEDGTEALQALEKHLHGKFSTAGAQSFERAVDDFIIRRFDPRSDADEQRKFEQRRQLAAIEINRQADIGRTHYLILRSPEDAATHAGLQRMVRALRERYRGLMCIELSRAFELELAEKQRFRPLLDLLPQQ
jgi:hypothetical protein